MTGSQAVPQRSLGYRISGPRWSAINVRTLSEVTRRENVRMRTETRVRRVTFDRVVRTKPLALAADAAI